MIVVAKPRGSRVVEEIRYEYVPSSGSGLPKPA